MHLPLSEKRLRAVLALALPGLLAACVGEIEASSSADAAPAADAGAPECGKDADVARCAPAAQATPLSTHAEADAATPSPPLAPADAGTSDAASSAALPSAPAAAQAAPVAPPAATAAPRMKLGTNFWNLGWGIWDDVMAPDADFSDPSRSPWNPAFLADLKLYGVLRFMDFNATNGSTDTRWEDRTQKTDGVERQRDHALAYEWMIDLCNRTGADMWINVPLRADDDYVFRLATLIKAQLSPQLKVYVEWSNETWNFQDAAQYASQRGRELGLDDSDYAAGIKFHVYRAVRVFQQFERVFGRDQPRLQKVIAGQSVNAWMTGLHLKALQDPKINPDQVKATAYAVAPYFGMDVHGASSDAAQALSSSIRSGHDNPMDAAKAQAAALRGSGLQLVAYEGGQHVLDGADVINARPEMYDIYRDYLAAMAPYFQVFLHYVHSGQWSAGGAWGAQRYVGQPLREAHKLRALHDFLDAQR